MTNYIVLNEDQLLANLARKLPNVKFGVFLEVIKMCEVEQEPDIRDKRVENELKRAKDELAEPKTDVLEKIKTEIESKYGQCDICEYFEDYDYEENDISEYRPIGNIADILQIIDKYKAESED